MSYTIKVLESGVLEIVHRGEMTMPEAIASRDEAGAMMKKLGLRLVLADVSRTLYNESTIDLFEFNASHYKVFPPGSALASVIPSDPDPGKAASAQFAETVALNRGIIMQIFLNYDQAMNWLLNLDKNRAGEPV
jgi:hypothetical protein